MIEKDIEEKIIETLKTLVGDDTIQYLGGWSTGGEYELKDEEEDEKVGYITVKVSPRFYEMPTIPQCTINIKVGMVVRSDIDYNGKTYLDLVECLMGKFEKWQKCLSDAHSDFEVDGFEFCGFQLDEGSSGIDRQ